ncbi:MAG TPA: choice-of-anchor D domain-containing protein [Bryobacteraceae bacterium]|nr:choice-of-anchor D domain-containing protein [Bryobacteraceae bacterium]
MKPLFLIVIALPVACGQTIDYVFDQPGALPMSYVTNQVGMICTGSVTPSGGIGGVTAAFGATCKQTDPGLGSEMITYQGTISLSVPAPDITVAANGSFIVVPPTDPLPVATASYVITQEPNATSSFIAFGPATSQSPTGFNARCIQSSNSSTGTTSCPIDELTYGRVPQINPYLTGVYGVRVGIFINQTNVHDLSGMLFFDLLAKYTPAACSATGAPFRVNCMSGPDVAIDHIEFVQAVQNDLNQLPLAANKDTMMRIFATIPANSTNQNSLDGVTATVSYTPPGGSTTTSPPLAPVTVTTGTVPRDLLPASLNFIVPADMTLGPTSTFTVKLLYPSGPNAPSDPNSTNPARMATVTQSFQPSPGLVALRVGWIPICLTLGGDFRPVCPSIGLGDYATVTQKLFPAASSSPGALLYEPIPMNKPPAFTIPDGNNRAQRAAGTISRRLALIKAMLDLLFSNPSLRYDVLVGWLAPCADPNLTLDQIHFSPSAFFIADAGASEELSIAREEIDEVIPRSSFSQELLALELAQGAGLSRTRGATIGEVGIDVGGKTLHPATDLDLMSTLGGGTNAKFWISPSDWLTLGVALGTLPPPSSSPPPTTSLSPKTQGLTEYALITGSVQQDNSSGQIDPILRLTSAASLPSPSAAGAYCLQIGNSSTTLSTACFNINFSPDDTGAIPPVGYFEVTVPWPAGATQVQLLHGNTALGSLTDGATAPAVTINSPHQGDQWNGPGNITWTAPGSVSGTVLYSYDGGTNWLPLSVDTTDSQYAVDTTTIKGGSQVFFRVIVSSGISTASATVGPITINQTPVIQPPTNVNFGTQSTGGWADQTAHLTNAGSGPLTIQSLSTDNPAFTVRTNVPFDILGGGGRDVTVRFSAGSGGSVNGNLIVMSNDPVKGTIRIPLVANSSTSPVPNLVPPPPMVNFGGLGVGQTLDLPIIIANNGSANLTVTSAAVTGPFQITAGMTPFTVPPDGQLTITVRFVPTTLGPQTGNLSMSTNDSGNPNVSVSLQGTGTVACNYSLNAAGVNPGSTASTGTVALTTGPTCTWAVSGNVPWLTSPATNGMGSATINYSVSANDTGAQRIGTLMIGDQAFTVTQSAAAAAILSIAMSHSPINFTQGQSGSYTITISNTGSAATNSGVTVTDTLPSGLTASSISGTGWTCTAPSGPCTRSDTLPQSSSYPPITLAVNVAGNAPASVTNTASISGGGAPNATTTDTATVVGTTLRTLVYHEITSLSTSANSGVSAAPVLSKNGTRAAFTTGGGSPFQVFVVNADGNSAPTQVDSFTRLCSCAASVFISDDGSAVVSSDGAQIRYAPASGSGGQTVVTAGNTAIAAERLSSDGSTIFFTLSGDGTLNGAPATRGLYAVNVNGSGLHQIVTTAAVGTALATSAGVLFGDPGFPVVDSSADSSRIIFSVNVLGVGAYLMAVNSNGQNLHKLAGPLSETYDAGISADGSTVYYDAVPQASGSPSQVGVVNFDGTNNRVLDTGLDGAGRPGQISADGSLVYVENGGRVYRSDGSGFYPLALNSPGANSHPVIGSFNASMNSTGTRFVYLSGDASGIRQLATIDVNPSSTGASPAVTNPAINPPFVLVNGGSAATVSASVTTSNTLAGVVGMVVKNGVPDPNINGQPMFDDGTHGDAVTGDGVFTNNGVRTDCCATAGARTVRIQAEDRAGTRRHGTAVDLATFAVVTSIPTTPITVGTNPPGRTFTVDGTSYTASQVLNLNQGSTHTIAVGTTPQAGATGTQYLFANWSDSGTASHSITVGASAATYTANFKTQYQLTISASPSTGGTVTPASGAFYDASTVVPITAAANNGFTFVNWTGNVASSTSASTSVTMSAPTTLTANFSATASSGLQFIPVTPCRIIDTRLANGNFGGPAIPAGGTRTVTIPQSACNIPATAQAYSLNATVVPIATLSYLSMWPAGQSQPVVSTLNSFDGRIVANAAIVPAGTNGAINLFASDATHVILDINGYFAPASTPNSLSFYSLTPCRVADTRTTSVMAGNSTRNFSISGGPCGVPASTKAYSLNMTVVPRGQLGYLTTWPAGQTQPVVSTLNSTDGGVVANAAIVPAGSSGAISVFVTDNTDVIIDINGYFAPPGSPAAQSLYTVTPCRVVDTRSSGGPLAANGQRSFPIPTGPCPGIPASSQAYSLNVTVVPTNTLTYLTAWPSGQTQPVVSTLNSFLGKIVANAAIVPAGQSAAISVFVTDPTQLILDINGYFAP